MKKRVVAILLSLSMCLVSGAETVIVSASDFTSGETSVQTEETETAETAETAAETESQTDSGLQGENKTAEEEAGDPVQTTETTGEESSENTSALPGDSTGTAEAFSDASEKSDFSDQAEDAAEKTVEETQCCRAKELGIAESDGILLYEHWENKGEDSENPDPLLWKLKKYQAPAETASAEEAASSSETTPAAEKASDTAQTAEPAEEEYYTSKDGLVKIVTLDAQGNTLASGIYLFDENGYMVTGTAEAEGVTYYFKSAEDAVRKEADASADQASDTQAETQTAETGAEEAGTEAVQAENTSEPLTPYNSDLGQGQEVLPEIETEENETDAAGSVQAFTGWKWTGTAWIYYLNDVDQKWTGLRTIEGYQYYLQEGGVPLTGDKDSMYFQPDSQIPGQMAVSKWICTGSGTNLCWRYFGSDGKYVKKAAGIYNVKGDGNYYLLTDSGKLKANKYYKGYLSDGTGKVYRNKLAKYNGYLYYFGDDCKKVSWKKCWKRIASADNKYYYFGKTAGRVQKTTGWQKITENGKYVGWFYFSKAGNMQKNKWMGNGKYYFRSDGRLASGVTKINGKYYFFQKSTSSKRRGKIYKSAWIKDKKKGKTVYYRANSKGVLVKDGCHKYNGSYYYFKNYTTVCNTTGVYNSATKEWGATDETGKFGNGWVIMNDANNKVAYISKTTGKKVKSQVVKIDGRYYRFNKNGYRVNDRTSEYKNRSSYYLECDRVNGVLTVYTDSSKTIPIKTIRVSVGLASTPTPLGTYKMARSDRWQALMGPSWGQYGTHVVAGIFVHSVACSAANSYNLPVGEYNKLGSPASHGCIRCCVADAKWVYENCSGSYIRIFDGTYQSKNSMKGPLGKNPLTPLRGSKNFDPTDPAC